MPGARWFPGSKLNYAEHIFRERDPGKTALITKTESEEPADISWSELERKTAAFASSLKAMGLHKGDRVGAYLPNVPETIVAFLACSSIGAIWSSCAPDFGTQSAVERFKQIDPKVLIAAYGYDYRGKWSSKIEVVEHIRSSIPSIEKTVMVGPETSRIERTIAWDDLVNAGTRLEFEQVP